jgi:hypothetical protein
MPLGISHALKGQRNVEELLRAICCWIEARRVIRAVVTTGRDATS